MRLLLDTHIWLWLKLEPARVPSSFAAAIANADHEVLVSVASVWELGIKHQLGKIAVQGPFDAFQRDALDGLTVLDIRLAHVQRIHDLPLVHRDPFDRILVAQALTEGLTLLTVDSLMAQYGVPILATD
jgi:PIN domain nuclease of toxin-antitoxin system